MISTHGKRRRTAGVVLAAVLSALMVLALPSIASARHGGHQRASGHHHGKRHHHRRHHRRHRHRHFSSADGSAGTIASFDADTGKLVISLDGGDTVSGLVTERTHIRCGGGCDKGSEDSSESQGADASSLSEDPPGHDGTPPGSSEDPGQGADHTAKCTTDALVVGAVVKRAELVIVGGKVYFTLVALSK